LLRILQEFYVVVRQVLSHISNLVIFPDFVLKSFSYSTPWFSIKLLAQVQSFDSWFF